MKTEMRPEKPGSVGEEEEEEKEEEEDEGNRRYVSIEMMRQSVSKSETLLILLPNHKRPLCQRMFG